MSRFMSSRFSALSEYVPGEQPQDMQYIKLNTNESPFPPSDGVIKAVNSSEVSKLNLYPDPDCRELIPALASAYGVSAENVFVSNGSDDILNFCFMGFCDAQTPVAFPDISYGFYPVYAMLHNLDAMRIPLRDDFTLNPDDYCGIGRSIVIANPNAPTGLAISTDEIERIVKSNPDNVVVIDEAYVDYGCESCVPLLKKYDNLLVCMTFSKSRSLAGARLGFALGSSALIGDLNKLKNSTNPYNINRLTNLAGLAALRDSAYYTANCKEICQTREYVKAELRKRGFTVTDSLANFLFASPGAMGGGEMYKKLKAMGVLVRHFDAPRIDDYLRITIGTRGQMDALLSAIDKIYGGAQ